LRFVDDYSPEVIYTALGNLKELKFIIELIKLRKIP
jgi:hypothetical protein